MSKIGKTTASRAAAENKGRRELEEYKAFRKIRCLNCLSLFDTAIRHSTESVKTKNRTKIK